MPRPLRLSDVRTNSLPLRRTIVASEAAHPKVSPLSPDGTCTGARQNPPHPV